MLVAALSAGLVTGLVATHVVLAGWTYRDAARRDLRRPGRWAGAVLVGGVFVFGPYVFWYWLRDRPEGGLGQAVRREVGRRRGAGETQPEAAATVDGDAEVADDAGDGDVEAVESREDSSVPAADGVGPGGVTAASVGRAAARLGLRGVRWAGRRAAARMANG